MTTTLPLTDTPVLIVARPEGGYRVAGTRVSLESALAAYLRGPRTAAAIHEAFPAVDLPTAAALIAYYALHEELVDRYLAEESAAEERSRLEDRALHPQPTLDELRRRRASA
ncbi:MAG: hypothetical protein IT303_09855 [Dehalococcoidia bacterium]|nr:hypothetical protein [Dehalococcoidia bacterium]